MLSNIPYILLALVLLGLIVTVHEFGHYLGLEEDDMDARGLL